VWHLVSVSGVVLTLFYEISFIFLIWNRTLRPIMLFLALMMHLGIGLFMGLGTFSAIMLTGCLAFVAPTSLRWLLETVFSGPRGYRFVYDHHDQDQVRAASWVIAADPWKQVEVVESHDKTATAPPGSLVAANGVVLHGMEAFARLVRTLRVLWLAWPAALWSFIRIRRPEISAVDARS
jgi:hypothetical protein